MYFNNNKFHMKYIFIDNCFNCMCMCMYVCGCCVFFSLTFFYLILKYIFYMRLFGWNGWIFVNHRKICFAMDHDWWNHAEIFYTDLVTAAFLIFIFDEWEIFSHFRSEMFCLCHICFFCFVLFLCVGVCLFVFFKLFYL